MAERGYELIIEFTLPDNNEPTYLHLDTIAERTVSSTNHLASQPIYNAQTLIDHMYVNPDSYTVSGIFSVYGKYYNEPYNYVPGTSKDGDRLKNIQITFEYIKNNGILCNLSTYKSGDVGTTRFKSRKNMAIESITFNEYESSMKYSITFKEVKEVVFTEAQIKVDVDRTGLILPQAATLGDILFSKIMAGDSTTLTMWDRILIGCLCQNKTFITEGAIILARKYCNNINDQRYRDIFNEIHNYASDILNDLAKQAQDQLNKYKATNLALASVNGAVAGVVVAASIIGKMSIAASVAGTASSLAGGAVASSAIASGASAAGASSAAGPVGIIIGACILIGTAIYILVTSAAQNKKIKEKRFNIIDNIIWDSDTTFFENLDDTSEGAGPRMWHLYEAIGSSDPAATKITGGADVTLEDFILENNPDTTPNSNELLKLSNFLNSANSVLNQLSRNARFYTISGNYLNNNNCECILTINGKPYKITFTNEPDYSKWYSIDPIIKPGIKNAPDGVLDINKRFFNKVKVSVKVYNQAGEWELLDGLNGVLGNVDEATKTNFALEDLDSSDYIFKDASRQYYCYLYNPWFEPETAKVLSGENNVAENIKPDGTSFMDLSNDLRKYYVNHSGLAYYYLVESYGTVKSVKDKLMDKIKDIITNIEV